MRSSTNIRALVALNAALLILLGVVTFAPAVAAQQKARGEYAMVAGGVTGVTGSVVWIADTINQELIAVTYDHNTKQLDGLGYRNLATDSADWMRGRTRPGG